MRAEEKKGLLVHNLLLFITLAATCAVAFVVVPAQGRTGLFFPALFAILVLELVGFLCPLFLALKGRMNTGVIRLNLGLSLFLSIYSVGVMILVLLAFGPASLSTVVALQLAWLVFFIFALGANAMGFLGVLRRRREAPVAALTDRFTGLCDRLRMVDAAEALPLKAAFSAARDDLHSAAAEMLPWSDMADRELSSCLQRMEQELVTLEAATNPRNIVKTSVPVPEAVSSLDWELRRMLQALKRGQTLVTSR